MTLRTIRYRFTAFAFSTCAMQLCFWPLPALAQKFEVKPIAEKKVKELPSGSMFWHIENFPTLAQAQTAAGPLSLVAEIAGKAWLFTIGPKGDWRPGGSKIAEVGPLAPITAPEYLLRINHSVGPPRSTTPVHSHPGSEAFYVLFGRMEQKTPQGVNYAEAGQSLPGHGSDTPMQVTNIGTTALDQFTMFVVDATRPFSSPGKLE